MIQIFTKEFKDAIRQKIEQGVDAVKSVATNPQTKAKIVNMYNNTAEACKEAAAMGKDALDRAVAGCTTKKEKPSKEEMESRTQKKRAEREANRQKAQAQHDEIRDRIKNLANATDVEEVYCQRSVYNPTFKENENLPIVTEVAKVTVIGIVKQLTNGKYRLQISFSRRNPTDQYIKSLGYMVALERAYNPRDTFQVDGHEFETIKVGDFESPLLKDLFLSIADELIDEYEYAEEHYTKPMRNSIQKNAEDLVNYVQESIKN